MQCKDIPDRPVLEFLAKGHGSKTWFGFDGHNLPHNSVIRAMPPGTPPKLCLAKMGTLIRRGLADGCTCGCRGGFEITQKGREFLSSQ